MNKSVTLKSYSLVAKTVELEIYLEQNMQEHIEQVSIYDMDCNIIDNSLSIADKGNGVFVCVSKPLEETEIIGNTIVCVILSTKDNIFKCLCFGVEPFEIPMKIKKIKYEERYCQLAKNLCFEPIIAVKAKEQENYYRRSEVEYQKEIQEAYIKIRALNENIKKYENQVKNKEVAIDAYEKRQKSMDKEIRKLKAKIRNQNNIISDLKKELNRNSTDNFQA